MKGERIKAEIQSKILLDCFWLSLLNEWAIRDHLAVAAEVLVDFSHIVVAVLGDGHHKAIADATQRVHVLDAKLGERPLAVEITRTDSAEE